MEKNKRIVEMIGLREASSRTGMSYNCLRLWCREGRIAHVQAGKKFFVNWDKLCEFLDRAGVKEEDL
jgi:predicted site-specific integrase-resolvase